MNGSKVVFNAQSAYFPVNINKIRKTAFHAPLLSEHDAESIGRTETGWLVLKRVSGLVYSSMAGKGSS